MPNHSQEPIETLRISDRDKQNLVSDVDSAAGPAVGRERRALRVRYTEARAILTLHAATGGDTKFAVVPRNLSRNGLAFVHGRFIYANARVEVMLKSLDGKWQEIAGVVRLCRHVSGIVHEVSVVFDESIDLNDFVELSPEEEMIHLEELAADRPEDESDEVRRLAGTVLVVDSFPTDRKLFCLWLSKAGFETSAASTAEDARSAIEQGNYDLAVIDLRLPGESGIELIKAMRASGFGAPILAVTAEEGEDIEAAATEAGASAILSKPFTAEQILEQTQSLVGVDLSNDDDEKPIFSSISDDEDMLPLMTEFVRGLGGYINKLRNANARDDREGIASLTHILKGSGSGYGFESITQEAGEVIKALEADTAEVDQLKQSVNSLVRVLNRVKLR